MEGRNLLAEIDAALPQVPKPLPERLVFHAQGCGQCEMLRKDLCDFSEGALTDQEISFLVDELSKLSPESTRWVMPSYLRRCVTQDLTDPRETEFLIYNLAPAAAHEGDTLAQFAALGALGASCLLHFLDWCQDHPHWSQYCASELPVARAFVNRLIANASEASNAPSSRA
jgi:hypothetical protein